MARALRCGRRCITGAGRTPTASAVSDRVGDTVSWELRWMGEGVENDGVCRGTRTFWSRHGGP